MVAAFDESEAAAVAASLPSTLSEPVGKTLIDSNIKLQKQLRSWTSNNQRDTTSGNDDDDTQGDNLNVDKDPKTIEDGQHGADDDGDVISTDDDESDLTGEQLGDDTVAYFAFAIIAALFSMAMCGFLVMF